MKRHAAKHLPKHVRELVHALARIGAEQVAVVIAKARYHVSWRFGGIAMHVRAARTPSGNAFECAWQAVRRLFRQHHLAVPA